MTAVMETSSQHDVAARRTALALWLSLAITLAAAVLGGLYFAVGGIFTFLSDLAGGLMGTAVLFAAMALHRLLTLRGTAARGATLIIGIIAGVLVMASSAGLIISSALNIEFGKAFLVVQFLGMAAIGAWIVSASLVARELWRRRTVVFGLISGGCYLLVGVGEPLMGFAQTLTYSAGSLAILSFIAWVVFATGDMRRIRE